MLGSSLAIAWLCSLLKNGESIRIESGGESEFSLQNFSIYLTIYAQDTCYPVEVDSMK